MSRITLPVLLIASNFWMCPGCANFYERQTITGWVSALEKQDLSALKDHSSDEFSQKALRKDIAIDDFKLLRLPKGDVSIAEVEDVSPTVKLVTVEVGKRKRRQQYRLTREPKTKKWVVDEVLVRQTREGLKVTKSVTEQMDLLLSLREFLDAWRAGTHQELLSKTTPELGRQLGELPPEFLASLTDRMVGNQPADAKLRPDVQMDQDVAVVRLPGSDGDMVLSCRLQNDAWKVSDVAVESANDGKHIPSVSKLAVAISATVSFLLAYESGDKPALAKTCTERFFRESLAVADLSSIELPGPTNIAKDFEVSLQDRRADFVIRRRAETVKINLVRDLAGTDADAPLQYRVDEVTIYELDGTGQEKRLSASLTAHAVMQVFSEALRQRRPTMLRKTASSDFNNRVWQFVDEAALKELPLSELENKTPHAISTKFQGALTQITVMQGSREVTYVLRDQGGKIRVDDVLLPVVDRPASLKATLEMMLPVRNFIIGIETGNIGLLQRTSSAEFNRLVWKQTKRVPDIGYAAPRFLQMKLSAIRVGGDEAIVILGDDQWGARIRLVKDSSNYAIDEILMIAGPESSQRVRLKHSMRVNLASVGLRSTAAASSLPTGPTPAAISGPADRDRHLPAQAPSTGDTRGKNAELTPPSVAPLTDTFGEPANGQAVSTTPDTGTR